ncbi:TRAP transporter small permease [Thermatribacter velox]|uniref:TRAP transporter small permease n=1 Tax=Thermatribacter velox TaxID=3039681 RepID=A0ABZ2YE67_9BACT
MVTRKRRTGMFIFDTVLDIITTIGFSLMLLSAVTQVLFRYALRISVPWTEELARYLLIYITFWGGAIAIRTREHISIPALLERLSEKTRSLIELIFIALMIIFLAVAFLGSLTMIRVTWETPTGSIGWLTMGMVYLALPTGVIFMFIYLADWALELIKKIKSA